METYTPTVVTLAVAKGLVAALFLSLRRGRSDRALSWWSASWALDGMRHVIAPLVPSAEWLPPLLLIGSGHALLAGSLLWAGSVPRRGWVLLAGACAVVVAGLAVAGWGAAALWPLSGGYLALTRARAASAVVAGPGAQGLRWTAGGGLLVLSGLALYEPWSLLQPSRPGWSLALSVAAVVAFGFTLMLLYVDRLREGVEQLQRQLQSVFEESGQNIAIYDEEGRFLRINPSFAALIRRAGGDFIDEALVPSAGDRLAFFRASDFSSRPVQRIKVTTPQAGIRNFDIVVSKLPPDGPYMVFAYDVSKQVSLERDLQHARRLEELGRISSGIAHDFNNVLNVINTYVSLGRLSTDPSRALEGIKEASRRGQRITQKLSSIRPRPEVKLEDIRVDSALREMAARLDDVLTQSMDLRFSIHEGPEMTVRANALQIEQLVFNLVSNARDASPDGGPIEITLTLTKGAEPRVRFEVADRGAGIAPEHRERVFDPFFSTKAGRAGLGLTAAQSIVEARGWSMEISGRSGGGTIVAVEMPAHAGGEPARSRAAGASDRTADASEPTVNARPPPLNSAHSSPAPEQEATGLKLLLLDDNPTLNDVLAQALRRYGHEAVTRCDPHAALAELAEERYDALITDVEMPSMSGLQVRDRAWETRPELVVVLTSGYGLGDIPHRPRQLLLQKPFRTEDLLCQLSAMIPGTEGARS